MMGNGGYWGPIATRLAGRVDLSAFDMPGHGQSPDWRPALPPGDYHTDVTRIAADFIGGSVDLIGHSMGATVALRLALAAPHQVRSLTLIEPVLFAAAGQSDGMEGRLAKLLDQGETREAARLFLSVWGTQPFEAMSRPMQSQVTGQIRLLVNSNATLNHDKAHMLRDGGLESITAPVMVIMGNESPPVIHAIGDALARRLPQLVRACVPGAGHMLPITHPREVAALIAENLDRATNGDADRADALPPAPADPGAAPAASVDAAVGPGTVRRPRR